MDKPKAVSRILTQTEARHLFEQFETIHCEKDSIRCPGWDPKLEHMIEGDEKPHPGGCRYKNSAKLCLNLEACAKGQLVIEIRPRNEDDEKREADLERQSLLAEIKVLKNRRTDLDEEIIALESKIRHQT